MFLPAQGFRHAVKLLLTNRLRAIPINAESETVGSALEAVAQDLVALADDMRAPADAADCLISEFHSAIDQLPHSFDRNAAKSVASELLARVGARRRDEEHRDLFLVFVPEDRLPVAAPLAVELAKRRVTVAFAEYEVASAGELAAAVRRGLMHHRGGVVLQTKAFDRLATEPLPETDRLRTLNALDPAGAADTLVRWVRQLRVSKH